MSEKFAHMDFSQLLILAALHVNLHMLFWILKNCNEENNPIVGKQELTFIANPFCIYMISNYIDLERVRELTLEHAIEIHIPLKKEDSLLGVYSNFHENPNVSSLL